MTDARMAALAGLSLALLAAGCASTDPQGLSQEPAFGSGYADGCATAGEEDKSFSTRRVRDEYMFGNDRAYRAGWRQGYIQCGGDTRRRNDGGRILGQPNEY